MLKEFDHNMIYIDSILKTTDYDFTLITAIVIDEFKKDYPARRCLISRKDHKSCYFVI